LNLRHILCLSLLLSCETNQDAPLHDTGDPQLLDLSKAWIYRIRPGQTLSEIAVLCDIPGGVETLAAWNGLWNPDLIHHEEPLRMPAGTECDVPLVPALLPRFEADWETCEADWVPLGKDRNDSIYADLDIDILDALDEDAYDAYLEGERWCGEPQEGMEICWKPYGSPGLQIHWQDELSFEDPDITGHGGAGGSRPEFAWVDLDGDGDRELLLTQLIAWSNGISMPGFRILVFEDASSIPIEESTWFYEPEHWLLDGQGGCDLLDTGPMRMDDPIRGVGNYYGGLRLHWNEHGFEYTAADTFPAQRMTDSFFRAHRGEPFLTWLLDGSAEARPMADARKR
jgi:hypothetical protein